MNEDQSVLSYLICRVYRCLGWGPSFILGPSLVLTPLNMLCCALKGDVLRILESCRWTALESIVCQGSENEVSNLHNVVLSFLYFTTHVDS